MGFALRIEDDWSEQGVDLYEDGDRSPFGRTSIHRRFADVEIAGVTVEFDVSRCGGEMPQAVADSLSRLQRLAELPAGWDSHGSAPLDSRVVRAAIELIVEGFGPCLKPEISLTSTGGLNLSWTRGARELEIELLVDGSCDYAYADEATGEEQEPDEPVSLADARRLLVKLR